MGLFSFGNKERSAPRPRRGRSASTQANARATTRASANERRGERGVEPDAMLLDPSLPEKQRARRRLVGAIALVVAAVVALPMILDSHPKPVTDDIAIDIPTRPAAVSVPKNMPDTTVADDDAPDDQPVPDKTIASEKTIASDKAIASTGAAVGLESNLSQSASNGVAPTSKPVNPADAAKAGPAKGEAAKSGSAKAQSPRSEGQGATNNPVRAPHSTAPNTAPDTARKSAAKGSGSGIPDNVINDAAQSHAGNVSNNRAASATPGTVADSGQRAPAGNRYVIHLGWLDSDAAAQAWVSKLKVLGVPAYTERHKQADGTERMMLRAGPFPDRAAASAAVAKVREAGLSGGAAGSGNASTVADGPARRAP